MLLLSPLLLQVPLLLFDLDWAALSNAGQSYTGVAALLSGAALVGVIYSINLQRHQVSLAQRQAVREMQFGLLRLEMEDPILRTDAHVATASHEEFRRSVLRTQWLRYMEFAYLSGELAQRPIATILEREIFFTPDGRAWWRRERHHWSPDSMANSDAGYRRFFDTVEGAWQRATDMADDRDTSAGP